MNETKSKWPFIVAGTAVGGVVGYLFLTDSGRRARTSLRSFDANTIPNKLEQLRSMIDNRGGSVTGKVQGVLDQAKGMVTQHRDSFLGCISEGRRAYDQAGTDFHDKVRTLETKNQEITAGIHRSVDSLMQTVLSFQQNIINPLIEFGSLAKGVEKSVRSLVNEYRPKDQTPQNQNLNENRDFGNVSSIYDRERVMG
jgi:hypothetical protein